MAKRGVSGVLAFLAATAATAGTPPSSDARQRYMPDTGWRDARESKFFEEWFGSQLRAMAEPPLSAMHGLAGFRSRLRMLVLPTFQPGHAIRIDEEDSGAGTVRYVRLDGLGGYDPGEVAEQRILSIGADQMARLRDAIAAARLRRLARTETPRQKVHRDGSQTITACFDGTALVLELVERNGSFLVVRACSWEAPVTRLALFVEKLAD